MEILQARILEWVAMPSSRGSSQPRYWTQASHIAGRFFTIWATREAHGLRSLGSQRVRYNWAANTLAYAIIFQIVDYNSSRDCQFNLVDLCVCACLVSCFSHVLLFVTPWAVSPPGSSVHGILQVRILQWVAMLSSRGSSQIRNRTLISYSSCAVYHWATGEVLVGFYPL